ncbi:hypothetical protein NIES2104_13220 [Leptolyngbya sp. NIES-2104]|nr:hypothetical protein NIES2104_13220 [Leptolyngbya sp. NIES-2104]
MCRNERHLSVAIANPSLCFHDRKITYFETTIADCLSISLV